MYLRGRLRPHGRSTLHSNNASLLFRDFTLNIAHKGGRSSVIPSVFPWQLRSRAFIISTEAGDAGRFWVEVIARRILSYRYNSCRFSLWKSLPPQKLIMTLCRGEYNIPPLLCVALSKNGRRLRWSALGVVFYESVAVKTTLRKHQNRRPRLVQLYCRI